MELLFLSYLSWNSSIFLREETPYESAQPIIYKLFAHPRYNYSYAIYDQANNELFNMKLELYPYDAVLVITEAIEGSSTEKLFQEKGE